MRQVPNPATFAIIGNGRMAKHIRYYFSQVGIPFNQWHRQLEIANLHKILESSSHVLILITDSEIDQFIEKHPILLNENSDKKSNKILVHFSGSYLSQYAHTAHPLMTFAQDYYDLQVYKTIPFVIEKEGPAFNELLPGLKNQNFKIPREQKHYYHSLCVMANNFTTLLWKKFFDELQVKFDIPSDVAFPILNQTFENIKKDYREALTGPLMRCDHATISNNLAALKSDNYLQIYKDFVEANMKEVRE